MSCCEYSKPQRKDIIIEEGGFLFKGFLSYCGSCGIVRSENTTIFDGKLKDTMNHGYK